MATVAVLALPEVVAFDLATPFQVLARDERVELCSVRPGPVATSSGFTLDAPRGLDALDDAHTVIVPGFRPGTDRRPAASRRPEAAASGRGAWPPPPAALDALRAAHIRGARLASICTGAFVLAATGLLDGRRVATHWQHADELARMFPAVHVDPHVLYVDLGSLLTSAGVAAGIDLCLHLLRRDHGAEVANAAARRTVVAPHRSGGQAQFIECPVPVREGAGLEATRTWAIERLEQPLTVAALARHASCSERTFARRFRAETGTTPLRWLLEQRILHARRLLERTELPVEVVARRCGFGSGTALREHFRRATSSTPTAYRRAFATA
jgi:transcriptional regulator GlxA family with amidase domain